MTYEKPVIEDLGSIAQHTFLGTAGVPPKDPATCTKDNFADESCPTP